MSLNVNKQISQKLLSRIFLLLLLMILPEEAFSAEATISKKRVMDRWEIIFVGENRIGYSNTVIDHIQTEDSSLFETFRKTYLKIKRFGDDLQITSTLRTTETIAGELLEFEYKTENPPAKPSSYKGVIEDGQLNVETVVNGQKMTKRDIWRKGTKSPLFQEYVLRQQKLKPGNSLNFHSYVPEYNQVSTINISAGNPREVRLYDGKKKELLSLRINQSLLPTKPIRGYMDENGNLLKSEMDFLGKKTVIYLVPKEVALEAISGKELDLAVGTLVPVHEFKDAHETRKVVYEITSEGGDPSELLVNDETQKVEKMEDGSVRLTVSRIEVKPIRRKTKIGEEYLNPSSYLQTRDSRIVELTHRVIGSTTDPLRTAYQLEKYVHKIVSEKDFSTALASAAEVAQTLKGDCTEHAVLLAAMLRVKRIPSRIVVGMVYVERAQAFGGHMWTEAWIGDQWVPLDATMGQEGIGAAHIKMGTSSFSDDGPSPITAFLPLHQILGQMQIRVLFKEYEKGQGKNLSESKIPQ